MLRFKGGKKKGNIKGQKKKENLLREREKVRGNPTKPGQSVSWIGKGGMGTTNRGTTHPPPYRSNCHAREERPSAKSSEQVQSHGGSNGSSPKGEGDDERRGEDLFVRVPNPERIFLGGGSAWAKRTITPVDK